jgi:hypothetical protein
MLTNSIEDAWWNNDDVNALYKTRSTSVGDKVIVNNKTFEYCASGIREIT